jgi:hypothetical protein
MVFLPQREADIDGVAGLLPEPTGYEHLGRLNGGKSFTMTDYSAPPTVERIEAAAYSIPTEHPESDGTLQWDSTTLVVVTAQAAGVTGIGYTYAGSSAAAVVREKLASAVQGEDATRPACRRMGGHAAHRP